MSCPCLCHLGQVKHVRGCACERIRTPFTKHRAKTIQAAPKIKSKTACRAAETRAAIEEDK